MGSLMFHQNLPIDPSKHSVLENTFCSFEDQHIVPFNIWDDKNHLIHLILSHSVTPIDDLKNFIKKVCFHRVKMYELGLKIDVSCL